MHILQIEHPIRDFDTWKMAFDSVDGRRQQLGVRGYRILQPTDDRNYVMIDLEFDRASEVESFLTFLQRDVWLSLDAAPGLIGDPQTRIMETVESKEY
jgi:hypothetical protein